MIMIIKIGTRGSKLALAQSSWVKQKIEARHTGIKVELVKIKTRGDKILDSPLSEIGGKGLFVKEIEDALLSKRVDLAVHSMKDVPAELPDGLEISVFPEREDPHDAFVSIKYKHFEELPLKSSIGTSSLRRSTQLLHLRPDLKVVPLRGNVDTRIGKLEVGDLQAIILAAAGLKRLGLSHKISHVLPPDLVLPAVGQGALGIELRIDSNIRKLLSFLNHRPTELILKAERAFLKKLGGGCQVPIAAYGRLNEGTLILEGMVAELYGKKVIKDKVEGYKESPGDIGIALADKLFSMGAGRILEQFYQK